MSKFYETLRSQALEMATDETPLATEPQLLLDQKIKEAGLQFDLDINAVMAQAEQYGKNPIDLGALAVYLFTNSKYGAGSLNTTPLNMEGKIRYPAFGICVDNLQSPDLDALNYRLRHEFRHVLQEKLSTPFYSRRWARVAVRAAAVPLAVMGWKQNIDILLGQADHGLLPAITALGSSATLAALAPYHTMWALTPREIDAHYFAWRNKDFAPLTLSSPASATTV